MKVNITRKEMDVKVNKGDVLVFEHCSHKMHYLVVENKAQGYFTLFNLASNNIMDSVRVIKVQKMLDQAKLVLNHIDFVDVIPADNIEVRTV